MGRLVQLWKVEDSADAAVYLYGASKSQAGSMRLSKKDQAVSLIAPVPGLPQSEEKFQFQDLAAAKLKMLGAKRCFPDETFIAT